MEFNTIKKICSNFQLAEPNEFTLYRQIDGHNTIFQVNCSGKVYMIKMYEDSFTTEHGLQIQGELCELFVSKGLPFARRKATVAGNYYMSMMLDGKKRLITLEAFIHGAEVESITLSLTKQIANLLAVQHQVSHASNLTFGYGTSWSMFGGNKTDKFGDYDENELMFRELMKELREHSYPNSLIDRICDLYYAQRNCAYQYWGTLPKAAVQGDFCPYNMLIDQHGNIIGIVDYNLAGDEVLINECTALAVYLAFTYSKSEGTEMEHLQAFFKEYTKVREITTAERKIMPTLISIIRPFRYDRVEPIIQLIRAQHKESVLMKLKETIEMQTYLYQISI